MNNKVEIGILTNHILHRKNIQPSTSKLSSLNCKCTTTVKVVNKGWGYSSVESTCLVCVRPGFDSQRQKKGKCISLHQCKNNQSLDLQPVCSTADIYKGLYMIPQASVHSLPTSKKRIIVLSLREEKDKQELRVSDFEFLLNFQALMPWWVWSV